MSREIYQRFLPDHKPADQPDRPNTVIRHFLGDPHARGRLVQAPEGDHSMRQKAKSVMKHFNRDEAIIAAKKLKDIARHPKNSEEVKVGAIILLNNISKEKLKPVPTEENTTEEAHRQQILLELITNNPSASNDELAKDMQCSKRTVMSDKQALREAGEDIPFKKKGPKPKKQ